MIMRITTRLGKKIGVVPAQILPAAPNPFTDWTAHLFTASRAQYIILTNTTSLYSMVMYGAGITDDCTFLKRATSYMGEFIRDDGHEFIFERLVAPSTATVTFSRALDRSVTGSMNDLVFQAKLMLTEREVSPWEVSFELNKTPMSYLKYSNPRETFSSMNASRLNSG